MPDKGTKRKAQAWQAEKPRQCKSVSPTIKKRVMNVYILERSHINAWNAENVLEMAQVEIASENPHWRETLYTKWCGKCFRYRGSSLIHERAHTEENPFSCKECGKCFKDPSACKVHEKTHTHKKPYQCKQCDTCFRQKVNLKKHELVHTEEKPYKGDKTFTRLEYLKVHNRSHKEKSLTNVHIAT